MRTKIIAGNLVAVLVVGLVSYLVVSSRLTATFLEEVDSQIAADQRLFERTWRLSGLEFMEGVTAQARQDASRDLFTSIDEGTRRVRARDRADLVVRGLESRNRDAGRPEVVVITDAEGVVVARNQDLHRMHGDDLKPQIGSLAGVLRTGEPAIDVWSYSDGQNKLLQTAIAAIREADGQIVGALVVGYDMSNGMADRAGDLLGRDVAFLTADAVYSSSLEGGMLDGLRTALFTEQRAATGAVVAGGEASEPWIAHIGGTEYIAITAALPLSPSTRVAYVVLADRTEQAEKASVVNAILILTGLGLVMVLVYGFLIGTSFIKPIEQMEEGILQAINGRTDVRLDIQSAELGGLAYRINQLLNIFTGTPEADEEGRVSSPPEAWASDPNGATAEPNGVPAGEGEDGDEAALAAKLADEPEDAYFERIFQEYVAAKERLGENVSSITKERFIQRLQANEASLLKKHGCRMVRFQVQTRDTQVNLSPVIIR